MLMKCLPRAAMSLSAAHVVVVPASCHSLTHTAPAPLLAAGAMYTITGPLCETATISSACPRQPPALVHGIRGGPCIPPSLRCVACHSTVCVSLQPADGGLRCPTAELFARLHRQPFGHRGIVDVAGHGRRCQILRPPLGACSQPTAAVKPAYLEGTVVGRASDV